MSQRAETALRSEVDEVIEGHPLSEEELRLLDAYWRAANYLSVGQVYLLANPLLRKPLSADDVKPARPFRDNAWPQPRLRPPQPGNPRSRSQRHLRHRPRPRRAGCRGKRLPQLHRCQSRKRPGGARTAHNKRSRHVDALSRSGWTGSRALEAHLADAGVLRVADEESIVGPEDQSSGLLKFSLGRRTAVAGEAGVPVPARMVTLPSLSRF